MSRRISAAILSILLTATFCLNANAGHIGDFEQTIRIEVDCSNCDEDPDREIKVQLYADGEVVPDTEMTLNSETGFIASYEGLPVFRTDTGAAEIKYQAGVSEKGKDYRILSTKKVNYETYTVDKWVSVAPEDLQDGHSYVLATENWNYEYNGYGPYVLVKGKLDLEQTTPEVDYKIIDGKKSYYSLAEDPSEEAVWTLTKVTTDDPDYELYPNNWLFTNYYGKHIVLSNYHNDDPEAAFWRRSGKNGYSEDEGSYNINKLAIVPTSAEENRGRFRIAGTLAYDGVLSDVTQYVGINHFYQVQAQTVPEYAAQFIAFEHVAREVVVATDITIETDLCPMSNPSTNDFIPYIIGIIAVAGVGAASVFIQKRR